MLRQQRFLSKKQARPVINITTDLFTICIYCFNSYNLDGNSVSFQGWDDVSFHGSPQIPTPNIDALAKSGVILNSYYVAPSSYATKAEFMTGKYASKLGKPVLLEKFFPRAQLIFNTLFVH